MSTVKTSASEMSGSIYPSAWEFDGLLKDGTAVCIRPIRPTDVPLLVEFYAQLSSDAIEQRYFGARKRPTREEVSRYAEVDYRDQMAFVAVVAEQPVGFASYDRLGASQPVAEIAFVVADEVQRHGVATLLFEGLAAYARNTAISHFVAEVRATNLDMLDVFGATGLSYERRNGGETVEVKIDLQPTREYIAQCDAREAIAEAASITAVLSPRSIAVVGAGRHPGNTGHEIVRSLLASDFAGTVYPVNPRAEAICGVPCSSSLFSLPVPVDLAIIAVPPELVRDIIGQAAAVGVRAAMVITAGFGETGESGAALEAEMLSVARHHGMRIVGPNCLGAVNTDPQIRMNATFAGLELSPGHLAVVSQSGAVAVELAHQSRSLGLGLSNFVSVGNKLDVSSNDLLCYLERDEATSVIALYLESFGNPRKFARIARRVGAQKPIVVLSAGRTPAGARGARSHTAAAATPDVVVKALLDSAGVIKVERLEELLDVSSVLLSSDLPQGNRVALVGNSGGPLILAADACGLGGLVVPEFDASTKAALKDVAGPTAALGNPVDLTADGTAINLEHCIEIAACDEGIDAVIVVVTELPALSGADARAAISRVARSSVKPIIACILGDEKATRTADRVGFAELPLPERAAAALAHVCRHAAWRERQASVVESGARAKEAVVVNEVVASALERYPEGGWLRLDEAAQLLAACGLPILEVHAAVSADEAVEAAEALGFPVALKANSGELVHKSDVGGVVTGLESPDAVRDGFEAMASRLGSKMGGAIVQAMGPVGVEAIVGFASDPSFGPVVMVGLGGVLTDLIGDRSFAAPPFDPGQAEAVVASLRAAPLLDGYRGSAVLDKAALIEIVELVAHIADQLPELTELDLNPVIVTASGAVIIDSKVRLSEGHAGPGPLFRALRGRSRT